MKPARELHWQSEWARRSLSAVRRLPGREKFFALAAYPGSSGFLHVGHLRGLVVADALHRYHRMRGDAVFFPTGTHASGLPSVTFAQKVANRDPAVVEQLHQNGVPESEWASLADPAAAARFLGQWYLRQYRRLGFLIDERAYVTTIDDDYQAFIRWQFARLAEHGALVQAPHFASVCPVCGPVSVDPSETDLSSGGDAEWIEYTGVPFRLPDGRWLLTATLRPETVYGVTNLWVHPTEPLVVWHHGDDAFLVSRAGAERLVEQHGGHVGHEVAPEEVIGRSVRVPLGDRDVPILPSLLVDPSTGTGVVMSVPAHAPADWLAVAALSEADRARVGPARELLAPLDLGALSPSERELTAGAGVPAERAVRATGARSLADSDALDEATERLYRLEFGRGRLRPELEGGATVAVARERVAEALRRDHHAFDVQAFSIPVICRNGHAVVIRRVPDQWFIHYSDPAWKAATRAIVRQRTFHPPEYRAELEGVLDWFADRPCVRRGRWLGTPFPQDPSWIIEPIADSTFYPAYFVVRPYVASGRLPVAGLTTALFDFVFLGRGAGEPTVDAALQRELREEFLYWYPLDLNIGGKEHKRVHFPVFLYTHALLLPEALQPRGILVHWWLTASGGEKISKRHIGSKKGRGIPPLHEATERWGADALRLFHASASSLYQDSEWDPDVVDRSAARIGEVERAIRELSRPGSGAPRELEAWLESEVHELLERAHQAFSEIQPRDYCEIVYATLPARLRRYQARDGEPGPLVDRIVSAWIRLLVPFTPHLAEELGEGRFDSLVAEQPFPRPEEFTFAPAAIRAERYLERVEEDLRSVVKLAQERGEPPSAVTFFVAAPWKRLVERWTREAIDQRPAGGPPVREVMDRAKEHPEVAEFRAQVPSYVQRIAAALRSEPPEEAPTEEEKLIRTAEGYLARRFGLDRVLVVPEEEGEAHDPLRRRDRARPGRPAFYLAGHRPARTPASP